MQLPLDCTCRRLWSRQGCTPCYIGSSSSSTCCKQAACFALYMGQACCKSPLLARLTAQPQKHLCRFISSDRHKALRSTSGFYATRMCSSLLIWFGCVEAADHSPCCEACFLYVVWHCCELHMPLMPLLKFECCLAYFLQLYRLCVACRSSCAYFWFLVVLLVKMHMQQTNTAHGYERSHKSSRL